MLKSQRSLTWAQQLADLEDPTPRDLDPENNNSIFEGEGSGTEDDSFASGHAREHYLEVGKSKIRNPNAVDLGPHYVGAGVSREALEGSDNEILAGDDDGEYGNESEDEADPWKEDEALENQDDREEYNGQSPGLDNEVGIENRDDDASSDDIAKDDEDMEHSQSDQSSVSSAPSAAEDERAAVRKMMAEEQKTVAASLSRAAKSDIEKGRAIKRQRTTFDTLLNTRIKLQKGLIATNTLPADPVPEQADLTATIQAAESAALTLWTSLNDLRSSLRPTPKKRPFLPTTSTSTADLWTEISTHEADSFPHRRATLTKWSQKTNPAASLSRQGKFSQAPTQQPLTGVLDQQLNPPNIDRLIARTRVPRSCAPVQANDRTLSESTIFDDADFYTLLLRELVDQRMGDLPAGSGGAGISLPSQRDLKVRKQVDTKASKGRKMRYQVHEKLQNFMAPDDRGLWGERQKGELFAGLLGRKVAMEEEDDDDGMDKDEEVDGNEGGGLRLFG